MVIDQWIQTRPFLVFAAWGLSIVCFDAFAVHSAAASEIDFERDIAPIFEEHCSFCHGEDEQESGFRLDRRVGLLRGGDYGQAAVVPGDVDKSYLITVVTHAEAGMEMPPDEDKISDEQIEMLKQWIEQGAVWPGQMDDVVEEKISHWAFEPLSSEFTQECVDDFLLDKLTQEGLQFNGPADPRALIRRVSIVLTGLAPTPERTEQFVAESSTDAEAAYRDLVDELLDSPHFGERWAQHWLDVIRWAETNGSESNLYRKNAWFYRDYVVRAFNEDKPYDQFIREQLAGDLLGAGDATGFLVAGPHVPAATVGQEATAIRQARADRIDEVLQTVGASVMGVTIGCARCHNHKFDPISIQDYYSMSDVFQDVEFGSRYPELSETHPRVVREAELRQELSGLRKEMLRQGWAWIEDWRGYQEVHFSPKTVTELRVWFDGRWIMVDEMEVLEDGDAAKNVAHESYGTLVSDNPATRIEGKPASKLINGVLGTKQWRAQSPKGVKQTPWVDFAFPSEVTVSAIRLSTNREDFYETDYLEGQNKTMYGEFRVAIQDKAGEWKPFCSTAAIKKRTSEDETRSAMQEKLQSVVDALIIEGPQPAFLATFVEPAETFVLSRGSPESPRDRVYSAAPKMLVRADRFRDHLGIDKSSSGPERRKALADWLVNAENPLTPRVIANRIWHHVFGSGIVSTPSDFGEAGAPPTHPELLDWLAVELVDSDWSMKALIRTLVTSTAFRQSSLPRDDGLARDAAAQWLWRFPPRRVEAEVIRDSILQASGQLDETVGGPSYRIHNVKKRYAQWEVVDNHTDVTWRRMLYQERMRRVDDRIFTAFDFPDCGQIKAKRPVSTTPLQALNLLNSDFVVSQSESVSRRAVREAGEVLDDQVERCFELLLARSPSIAESEAAIDFASEQGLELLCRTLMNTNEFAFLP